MFFKSEFTPKANHGNHFKILSQDDFRGCSPFALEGEYTCQTAYSHNLAHRNCKNTCSDSNCNNGPLSRGHSCYSCSATRNSMGEPVGTGDDRCFDSVYENDDLVMDCPEGSDYCNDELLVDWTPKGDQVLFISLEKNLYKFFVQ